MVKDSRISIITETFAPEVNGVANTLGHIVAGLRNKGCEVQVIRPRQFKSDVSRLNDGLHTVTLWGIPIPGYAQLKFGLPLKSKIARHLKAFSPDAIYVATEGPLGFAAVNAARSLNLPIVSGFHTNFHQYIEHYHLGWLESLVYRYLRYFHNRTLGTLVPTARQKDELVEHGFNNVQVLARGVDSNLFSPEKRDQELRHSLGLQDDDLALIYVGRIAGEKNLDLAIRTYQHLSSINNRVKLILVGDGPQLASIKANSPEVLCVGVKRSEELAKYYASGDVFLFPSKTDTFGNVVTEAMASGLGVVSFDYAAAHEHIENHENGMLAEFGDEDAFVQAAEELLASPNKLEKIRHKAREHAQRISWEQIVNDFLGSLSLLPKTKNAEVNHYEQQQTNTNGNKDRVTVS